MGSLEWLYGQETSLFTAYLMLTMLVAISVIEGYKQYKDHGNFADTLVGLYHYYVEFFTWIAAAWAAMIIFHKIFTAILGG
jgi:hypothetical protein